MQTALRESGLLADDHVKTSAARHSTVRRHQEPKADR
jgi:hypothetical protein